MATRTTVTPLYVLAGAGDLAIEKLREVSEDVTARFVALKDQPKTMQTELNKLRDLDLPTEFNKLRDLPTKVQHKLTVVAGQAEAAYDDLADRGKDVVTRIRKQEATEATVAQAKSTVSKVKAAQTSTRKTAKSATKAATAAADKVGD